LYPIFLKELLQELISYFHLLIHYLYFILDAKAIEF